MIDVKVRQKNEIDVRDLDQLLGYFLLARDRRRSDRMFPAIEEVAIYFARQAHLWRMPTSFWTEQPDFPRVEIEFFERARDYVRKSMSAKELVDQLVQKGYTRVVAETAPIPLVVGATLPRNRPRIVREPCPLPVLPGDEWMTRSSWRVVLPNGGYASGPSGSVELLFRHEADNLVATNPGARVVHHRSRRRRLFAGRHPRRPMAAKTGQTGPNPDETHHR
jgi:hypothetical protein